MIRFPLLQAALLGSLLGFTLGAAAQTDGPLFIVGVCSHELHKGDVRKQPSALISAAGITSVRTDAHWAYVERERNRLVIEPSWPRYLADTRQHGLDTLFILGYGNRFHGDGEKPRSEPVRASFNRYVAHLAERLKGQVAHYEVWNEWDVEDPKSPAFTQDYSRLIADAAGIIRQHDPDARVLAGAVTTLGIESGFAQRLVENGVLQSVDGLSLHPYVHCRGWRRNTPEAWIAWLAEVDQQLTLTAGRPVPLYLTEMAWPAHEGACGISETLQAAYLARSYFLARTLPNIKGMWWYDFRNDGTDRREREHNFGLLRHDYSAKPAYAVLQAISEIVSQYELRGQERRANDDVVLLRFAKGTEELIVAWSGGRPRTHAIETRAGHAGNVQLLDTAQPQRGRFTSDIRWNCPSAGRTCTARIELNEFPKVISTRPVTAAR
ncbi:hypothetical protein N8H22_09830 [Stutzerimonas stutzeri]|uniref:hypothetical protein n=1 Tax=Stutzerimonas sp. S1 TaxID=3030652 RepID=UPI002224D77C|nr:hypothetical protein [Stutzerimonas sp. S1]MCW3148890.1 hypothetical protein [Stutzerimonas sp. S1]